MKKFYLTFGQQSPLRDNWILVEAKDEADARAAVFEVFGRHWSMLYHEIDFNPSFFPGGQVGKTLIG